MTEPPFILAVYRVEREKSQGIDPSKALKTAEDVKAHLENQLKQARLAAQQVGTLSSRSRLVDNVMG